jgi:C-terminal processing protease CtpA/Prc
VRKYQIHELFAAYVPIGRAINPISKDNWEGKGIAPDVEVPAAKALATATQLAARAINGASPPALMKFGHTTSSARSH